MAKIDIPTKRLIQIRPMDWVRAILPECDEAEITEIQFCRRRGFKGRFASRDVNSCGRKIFIQTS